jgi:serine/threonine protein phosphatase PrpC
MEKRDLVFDTAALTDIGRLRKNNEDKFFMMDKRGPNGFKATSYGIYLVADGMGGHQAGEVASEIASKVIPGVIKKHLEQESAFFSPLQLIKQGIIQANQEIFGLATEKKHLHSMGTTVTVGLRLDNQLYLGHVGDSRCYLIRNGEIRQLTEDHSLIGFLLRERLITRQEAERHPEKGKIFRCLGVSDRVSVDLIELTLKGYDSLIFCTDGLTNQVNDREILESVARNGHARDVCRNLINIANTWGGEDNTSIIAMKSNLLLTRQKSDSIGSQNILYDKPISKVK